MVNASGRQAETCQQVGRKLPLEREIVDRHHRRRFDCAGIVQIGRREPSLPVMRVHHVRPISVDLTLCEQRRDARQRGEAERIVGPIPTIGPAIRIAIARIEMRRVDDEQVEPCRLRRHDARRAAEQIVQRGDRHAAFQRIQYPRIARHQRTHRDALRGERARQRAGDIGEATGLDQRKDLRDHREDVDRRHHPNRSSIGWVIRQTPCSVRRKRCASASGSSPTTSPSGIRTPRSTMTLRRRAERPMST